MHDIQQIRKSLLWGVPLSALVGAGSLWLGHEAVVRTVQQIAAGAAGVRIAPAAQLAPFVAALCILGIVVGVMRAIPFGDGLVRRAERAFNITVAASAIALLLLPVTSIAQHYYMPSIGYTQCHILQGQPMRGFTDWVRDPAWCVKGKSLDWVNEQAKALASHGVR
ncbi:hypothetical protein C8246_07815 [Paracidovorax avenae]|uniref:hypothetical protein n=1 Tax=Paracidovorax avenae TaxID=80867 RepID=UPI000D15AA1B|nr:hypothetical protein [Paracidovorax avenae]AVS91703.1 hypothetical protein C8246_07815 [Paracidovorax avenae]AVT05575.1 hypothetical protein C8248_05955 [Paracidovorax avenae]AVT19774.1 hypothetical protein C7Y68_06855 [Paracidovorax avenae]